MFERLTQLISGANIAGATAAAKPTTTDIAREVIAGDWGSGDKRIAALKKAGYNPDVIQAEVNRLLCCRELIIQNIRAWATKIANSHKYKYVYYDEPYGQECAVCHPHNGANKGWQCIGYAWACWHHGGLPSKCNCGVLNNAVCEKIMKASTDAEALSIARKYIGLNDIKVIRNNKKTIPKEWAQPGDIALLFNGDTYQHTYVIMSDNYIADSTSAGGFSNDISATRKFQGRYVSGLKVLIRYTGKGFTTPAKKSINELAYEVIDGKWGSGDSRKRALLECKYDYNAIQKRVNEILNPPKSKPVKKTIEQVAQEVIDGKWGSGDARKKKLIAAGYDYNAVQKKVNELLAKKTSVKKRYTGQLPTTTIKKTNAEVINDTVRWALWIAKNKNFHYGYTNKAKGANAHHNGCYFCKTQRLKKNMLMPEHTYCSSPFVTAAWAHGGCVPKALSLCRNAHSWGFDKNNGYAKSSLFTNLGHPAKFSLKKGDVLCRDTHVALYIGNGKIVEAGSGDDNVKYSNKWNNSIRVKTLTDTNYKNFPRVHRFNSSVKAVVTMAHGEISNRVLLWQKYLNWYFGSKVVTENGIYGDTTLKYTKQFQEKEIGKGQGDGLVGPKTLAAAAAVKK